MKKTDKTEDEIFSELESLCSSPGYIHVIAFFCYRDNVIQYSGKLTSDNMMYQYSHEKLIRTEISTLLGLLCKNEIKYNIPSPKILQEYIERTEELLKEIHYTMVPPLDELLNQNEKDVNPLQNGKMLREAIFYGGDSAYDFQYKDFSLEKYKNDEDWFIKNKGFSVSQAYLVIKSIEKFQVNNLMQEKKSMLTKHPNEWTILPAFEFSINDIAIESGIDIVFVEKIILSFVAPKELTLNNFNSLDDFNPINAYPIIPSSDSKYLLFQTYGLVEALYETPFFWFNADPDYKNIGMKHRGEFTEDFSKERLKLVFGENNVYTNIDIVGLNNEKAGEIDVLVIYSNRAIILQAKSKKLTISARKGNDNSLQNDFKKAIQDAYNQGYSCAELLENSTYKLLDSAKNELSIKRKYKEIYIFCIVSDHYPALSFQSQQFLKFKTSHNIMTPFIMDVFLLDIMTEMLDNPLYFLSYINRRTNYGNKLLSTHELVILSFHLKQNLWISDEYGIMQLGDDIIADLDVAMLSRRLDAGGLKTPSGILTKNINTYFGNIIEDISLKENDKTIDLGFLLLSLSSEAIEQINFAISKLIELFKKDRKHHDFTIGLEKANTGLTIHCNNLSINDAKIKLEAHCEIRKYSEKVETWFGICIDPNSGILKFGLNLNYNWVNSEEMNQLVKDMPPSINLKEKNIKDIFPNSKQLKVGRNHKCPCGSGKKFKKCCMI